LTLDEATALCERAAVAAGAAPEAATSLARSVVAAEAKGVTSVGLSHFLDYLHALDAGRLKGRAEPALDRPAPAVFVSDAQGGAAHTGFDRIFDHLAEAARLYVVAIFSQRNAFTCGELGYFTRRLAERGLVSFAATNGPALVAGAGGTKPVYCTNPLSFAAPVAEGAPLVIDQSSSATAFVTIRKAAEEGRKIPEGWALDPDGNPTTDPAAAIRGTLLAFGGNRGANIALMVEVLSAGLSGANWSLDAPPFAQGSEGPGTGLFVLALEPRAIDPEFASRLGAHLDRLASQYDVHIPGRSRTKQRSAADNRPMEVDAEVVRRIVAYAEGRAG
jgi:(2R)-3-sulfolactate dehydrogenase (NADP+)